MRRRSAAALAALALAAAAASAGCVLHVEKPDDRELDALRDRIRAMEQRLDALGAPAATSAGEAK